ncbi:conserved hypothetical protein [Ricinus communis]|uniref:Uncharacterized protein n=1 Tax=Ricinus communis TaxID=3988 RepID=B9S4Z2_RICCO|nr:conserved hypothetical protein [Ricinus communis]
MQLGGHKTFWSSQKDCRQDPSTPYNATKWSAPTIEMMPTTDMQTIEDGLWGKELELDNFQDPILEKSKYLAIGKCHRLTQPLILVVALPHGTTGRGTSRHKFF